MARFQNHRGFTLIELMLVVGILGILVTIGVAGYSNMMYKTRQNQAKSNLTILYGGMENFHTEWNEYYGDWANLGVEINGDLYYRLGFTLGAGSMSPQTPRNYIGPGQPELTDAVGVSTNHSANICGTAATDPCVEVTGAVCVIPSVNCLWTDSPDTFLLCACGNSRDSSGAAVEDQWELNHLKEWTHTQL